MADELKKKPIGEKERVDITSTHFASNKAQNEIKVEGKEFDHKALLEMLGFKEKDGKMIVSAYDCNVEIEGKIIRRRTTKDGIELTNSTKPEQGIDRD